MDQDKLKRIVDDVLHRVPAWVRSDLSSSDAALRERAEDVLAAMIGAALGEPKDKAQETGLSNDVPTGRAKG